VLSQFSFARYVLKHDKQQQARLLNSKRNKQLRNFYSNECIHRQLTHVILCNEKSLLHVFLFVSNKHQSQTLIRTIRYMTWSMDIQQGKSLESIVQRMKVFDEHENSIVLHVYQP
jgi:hypothetical protein